MALTQRAGTPRKLSTHFVRDCNGLRNAETEAAVTRLDNRMTLFQNKFDGIRRLFRCNIIWTTGTKRSFTMRFISNALCATGISLSIIPAFAAGSVTEAHIRPGRGFIESMNQNPYNLINREEFSC
jgi:hypothetical protein